MWSPILSVKYNEILNVRLSSYRSQWFFVVGLDFAVFLSRTPSQQRQSCLMRHTGEPNKAWYVAYLNRLSNQKRSDEFKVQKIRGRPVSLSVTLRVLKADRRPPLVNSRFGSLCHARSSRSRVSFQRSMDWSGRWIVGAGGITKHRCCCCFRNSGWRRGWGASRGRCSRCG